MARCRPFCSSALLAAPAPLFGVAVTRHEPAHRYGGVDRASRNRARPRRAVHVRGLLELPAGRRAAGATASRAAHGRRRDHPALAARRLLGPSRLERSVSVESVHRRVSRRYAKVFGERARSTRRRWSSMAATKLIGSDERGVRRRSAGAAGRVHLPLESTRGRSAAASSISIDLPPAPAGTDTLDVFVALTEDDSRRP